MMEIDKVDVPKEFKEPIEDSAGDSSTSEIFDDDGHANPNEGGRRGRKRKQPSSSDEPCRGDHSDECGAQCEDREERSRCEGECETLSEECEQCEDHGYEWDDSCSDHDCPENQQETECENHFHPLDSDVSELEEDDISWFNSINVRPTIVPRAPENTSQFIIDDHDECELYKSFQTPNPYLVQYLEEKLDDNSEIIEPNFEDDAYSDINYQYVSPHDFDNSAYYDKQFDIEYTNNRINELNRLSRADLISGLQNLESHLKELNKEYEEVIKEDPTPTLENLQSQLLELQEKNFSLKEQKRQYQEALQMQNVDPDASLSDDTLKEDNSLNSVSSDVDVKNSTFSEETHQEEGECVLPAHEETRTDESHQENHVSYTQNNCKEDATLQARTESCNARDIDSCSVVLRDSEYEGCEEAPLNSVPEVTV